MRSLLFAIICAIPSAAPAQRPAAPAQPSVALPPVLDRVLRDYERAWQGRDATALAELFVDGEVVIVNTGAHVRGREGVKAQYEGSGGAGLALRAVAFALGDSVAHIIGGYGDAPGAADAGTFVLALKRSPAGGGRWLIAADMDRAIRR